VAAPIIGITADRTLARWDKWHRTVFLCPETYVRHVEDAGGLPVILTPGHSDPRETVSLCDGLLFTGGLDMDPRIYGQPPHPATRPAWEGRDEWELTMIASAVDSGTPTLGICRGMQLINVALGGTLTQHLPDVVGSTAHLPKLGGFGRHAINVAPASLLFAAVGGHAEWPTHHHQAVDRLGSGVIPTAWASDGTVEGLEVESLKYMCGVQCHPEECSDGRIFRDFVLAASTNT
jgi:putative glutamine amidotransferase